MKTLSEIIASELKKNKINSIFMLTAYGAMYLNDAVEKSKIKSVNGKPWTLDPATGKGKGSTPKANANQLIKSIQGMDKPNQDALLKILQQSMKTQGA